MTYTETQIWDQLPVVRWEFYIERHEDLGYKLRTRHAHAGSLLSDCPAAVYSWATLGELLDVLDAELSCMLPHRSPER